MNRNELPIGFGFALAMNPDAMNAFSALPESRKNAILQQARTAASEDEMQAIVNGLSSQG